MTMLKDILTYLTYLPDLTIYEKLECITGSTMTIGDVKTSCQKRQISRLEDLER